MPPTLNKASQPGSPGDRLGMATAAIRFSSDADRVFDRGAVERGSIPADRMDSGASADVPFDTGRRLRVGAVGDSLG